MGLTERQESVVAIVPLITLLWLLAGQLIAVILSLYEPLTLLYSVLVVINAFVLGAIWGW